MTNKIAFVSDFDGTITDDDFFYKVVDAYFDESNLAPWHKYMAGDDTHFNALREMFLQIHIAEDELNKFISTIKIDEHTDKVWELCFNNNIPMYICSAGNDYYIKELIGDKMQKYDIELITNPATYSQSGGLDMQKPDESYPYFDKDIGISKSALIKKLKDDGYFVIFAGDGPPDIAPALISDTVFARKILLEKLNAKGLKSENFDSYQNIYDYIKRMLPNE